SMSCWAILAKSRLPNCAVKRSRTNSQVLTVFFFGICPVVLQMKIDSLLNFHDAPPVELKKVDSPTNYVIKYLSVMARLKKNLGHILRKKLFFLRICHCLTLPLASF
ncbi:MAG: hypothetical protein PF442_02920, partial [Desulfobulbaceae bacterium]|nr:hypothetical protein [Desulfobulbaceae bacterium]